MIETERLIDERIAPGSAYLAQAYLAQAREHNLALHYPVVRYRLNKV